MAEKQLEAMVKMADKGNMIIVPVDFKGIINYTIKIAKLHN